MRVRLSASSVDKLPYDFSHLLNLEAQLAVHLLALCHVHQHHDCKKRERNSETHKKSVDFGE